MTWRGLLEDGGHLNCWGPPEVEKKRYRERGMAVHRKRTLSRRCGRLNRKPRSSYKCMDIHSNRKMGGKGLGHLRTDYSCWFNMMEVSEPPLYVLWSWKTCRGRALYIRSHIEPWYFHHYKPMVKEQIRVLVHYVERCQMSWLMPSLSLRPVTAERVSRKLGEFSHSSLQIFLIGKVKILLKNNEIKGKREESCMRAHKTLLVLQLAKSHPTPQPQNIE